MRIAIMLASAVALASGAIVANAQQAAVEPAPAASPAASGEAGKSEDAEQLAAFYGMQLAITECALKVSAHDVRRLSKFIELAEASTKLSPEELAKIKIRVLTRIKSGKDAACSEGRVQAASLPVLLDELDKQSGGALTAALGASPAPATKARAAPSDGQALSGLAAIQALVGNTIVAKVNGVTYHDYLLPDGTLKNLEDSTVSVGKWTAEGGSYCTSYKGFKKICYSVDLAGSDLTLTEKSGQAWRYKLLPGNPKKL